MLRNEQLERASNIFATQNDMTASPLGSPTAVSPHLAQMDLRTWTEWLAARQTSLTRPGKPARNGKRKIEPPKEQIRLFG